MNTLTEILKDSKRIVFFGGAGTSTESGIPDFRSQDGLYHQQYAWPPEEILSHTFFMRRPEEFYRFYRDKMSFPGAQPNAAHKALVRLEQMGKLSAVITQNIDGLHQKAGSRRVLELHGSIHRKYCMKCGRFFSFEDIMKMKGVPHCSCGGMIKPDVVLYEESLDGDTIEQAVREFELADTLIIGGTSLVVYPAAGMVHYFRGRHLVQINRDPTSADSYCELSIHDSIGKVLGEAVLALEEELG